MSPGIWNWSGIALGLVFILNDMKTYLSKRDRYVIFILIRFAILYSFNLTILQSSARQRYCASLEYDLEKNHFILYISIKSSITF